MNNAIIAVALVSADFRNSNGGIRRRYLEDQTPPYHHGWSSLGSGPTMLDASGRGVNVQLNDTLPSVPMSRI